MRDTDATTEEENQRVQCIDDITRKELPRSEVRQAREQVLQTLRHFGVYNKVDERDENAKYQSTPAATMCIDTNRAFGWEPMRSSPRLVAQTLHGGDRPDLCAGTLQLEALKAMISIAANHKHSQSCTSTCHVRTFKQRLRDLCWYVCQRRTREASTLEQMDCGERSCTAHGTQQAIGSVIGKNTSRLGDIRWDSARRTCFDMRKPSFRNDTW